MSCHITGNFKTKKIHIVRHLDNGRKSEDTYELNSETAHLLRPRDPGYGVRVRVREIR